MEPLVIKLMRNYYSKDGDIKKLLKYICGKGQNASKEKVIYVKGKGLSTDYGKAAKQIVAMQERLGKNNKRRCYHWIISFPCDMQDKNVITIIAEEIADMFFRNFQVYYAVHNDTQNLHIHIAVNAVSYVHGHKWHNNDTELEDLKKELLRKTNDILDYSGYEKLRLKKN